MKKVLDLGFGVEETGFSIDDHGVQGSHLIILPHGPFPIP